MRLLALVLLVGCARAEVVHLPKKPGQATAEAVIVQQLEQLSGLMLPPNWEMPDVSWVEAPKLDCAEGTGWAELVDRDDKNACPTYYRPTTDADGKPKCQGCVLGRAMLDEDMIYSNWAPDRLTGYDQTSLTHEYCHFFRLWQTGDGDVNHTSACYVPGGWVEATNAALRTAAIPLN